MGGGVVGFIQLNVGAVCLRCTCYVQYSVAQGALDDVVAVFNSGVGAGLFGNQGGDVVGFVHFVNRNCRSLWFNRNGGFLSRDNGGSFFDSCNCLFVLSESGCGAGKSQCQGC